MELQVNGLATAGSRSFSGNSETEVRPISAKGVELSESQRQSSNGRFLSPLLAFDNRAFVVIFQVRDTQSGDVERQFPRQSVVESMRVEQNPPEIEIAPEESSASSALGGEHTNAEEAVTGPSVGRVDNVPSAAFIGNGENVKLNTGGPEIGQSSAGVADGLGPSNQGVNILV